MNRRILFAAGTWLCSGAAVAAPIALNEGALARGFALPALGQMWVPEPGHLAQQFDVDLINEFYTDSNVHEALETDGETARFAWRGIYGVAPSWNVGITLPFYIAGGGFLDGSIEGWHRFFNLPNSNRADRQHNRIFYRYDRGSRTLLDVHESGNGIGDVRLEAGRAFGDLVALRAQLKLPTGSASHLLGNRAWGGALWADFALPLAADSRFEAYVSGGVSYTGKGDVIAELQRNFVPFGGAGVSCRLFAGLGANVQVGVHGPLYRDTEMEPISNIAVPLSFGLNYRFSPGLQLEVLVQEDASIYASPDFFLHFALAMP